MPAIARGVRVSPAADGGGEKNLPVFCRGLPYSIQAAPLNRQRKIPPNLYNQMTKVFCLGQARYRRTRGRVVILLRNMILCGRRPHGKRRSENWNAAK